MAANSAGSAGVRQYSPPLKSPARPLAVGVARMVACGSLFAAPVIARPVGQELVRFVRLDFGDRLQSRGHRRLEAGVEDLQRLPRDAAFL